MLISEMLASLVVAANGAHQETARVVRALLNRLTGFSTGTASAGAVTLNALRGVVTTESLTTAQNGVYTLTITNSEVAANDHVLASVGNGTNTQGTPTVTSVTPAAGSLVVRVSNLHASAQALNGTLRVSFAITKAA